MYRGKDESYRIRIYVERDRDNKRNKKSQRTRMCNTCGQRATISFKGQLYCTDCAEREGIKNGQGKNC